MIGMRAQRGLIFVAILFSGCVTHTLANRGSADQVQKLYRSPVNSCLEAAIKACEKQGYTPKLHERDGTRGATVRSTGKGHDVQIKMVREGKRTRVVFRVTGASTDENRESARALHRELEHELREEGQ